MTKRGVSAGRFSENGAVGWAVRFGACAVPSIGLVACGLFASGGPKAAGRGRVEPRDTRLVHEECAVAAASTVSEDINGDGQPDRRTAAAPGGKPACRALDFNFDGVVDAWVYLDEVGRVRRRESDYDRDGSVDEVCLYRAGVLIEQQRATARAGKLDTWHYFEAGKMARTERDSNGDDYIDQWWEYPEQRAPECPLIHSDVDGDGRPDPGATVDLCSDRYAAQAGSDVPGATSRDAISDLPTEVPPASSEATEEAPDGANTSEAAPPPAGAPRE
jgi:hypothetical protein